MIVGAFPGSMRFSQPRSEAKIAPEGACATPHGFVNFATSVTCPAAETRTSLWRANSTTRSDPPGAAAIPVGSSNTRRAARTRTDPSLEREPPTRAVSFQTPERGNTNGAWYEPWPPRARAVSRRGPVATTWTEPWNERGRTASFTTHGRPVVGETPPPTRVTRTPFPADAPSAVLRSTPAHAASTR